MKQNDRDWSPEEAQKFAAGLKKMGFKRLPPDCEDFARGTETWSLKLGPVTGAELKAAARRKTKKEQQR